VSRTAMDKSEQYTIKYHILQVQNTGVQELDTSRPSRHFPKRNNESCYHRYEKSKKTVT